MNINLDDKKIVRVVYAIDNYTELSIEFKNGNICAINKQYKNNHSNSMNEIKDMLEKSKSANWANGVVNKRKEIDELIERGKQGMEKSVNAKADILDCFNLKPSKKSEIKNLYECKKLIDMDKDGKLDEIIKEYREHGIPDQYGSVLNAQSEDDPHFEKLNKGLDDLKYATDKISDKYINKNEKEEKAFKEAIKNEIEKEAANNKTEDFVSTLDAIKENAEKYIDAKELDAKENEKKLKELIPNFEVTQILMELVKMGYFDEIEKMPEGNKKSMYMAKAMIEAVNNIKAIKSKNDD